MSPVFIDFKEFSLSEEQLENLASEFYGKLLMPAGITDECEVVFKKGLDYSEEFIKVIDNFRTY